MKLDGVDQVSVDFTNKTADVTMKPGAVLDQGVVADALKKSGRYGVTGFKENKPKPKSKSVTVGISGMT